MESKLTLRLNTGTIEKAKKIARSRGVSVSKLVEQYFELIADAGQWNNSASEAGHTPVTDRLQGIIKDRKVTEEDYRNHLERKYLNK